MRKHHTRWRGPQDISRAPLAWELVFVRGPEHSVQERMACIKKLIIPLRASSYVVVRGWSGEGLADSPVQKSLGGEAWSELLKSWQAMGSFRQKQWVH